MKQNITEVLANGTIALAAVSGLGSSWLGFLQNNAAGLGVIMTFVFGCVGIALHIYNARKSIKADDNEKRLNEKDGEIEELRQQISEISDRKRDR